MSDVYFVVSYDIADEAGYADYVPAAVPTIMGHGGEVVVADYEAREVEGEKRGVTVVLKFPSEEAAMNWYNDPSYEPAKQIRLRTTENGTAVLAQAFAPPT